jgi:hypothetical protein
MTSWKHKFRDADKLNYDWPMEYCKWYYNCCIWQSYTNKRIILQKNPGGSRFSAPIQTGSGAHPASCTMGTGSFPQVKAAGAW